MVLKTETCRFSGLRVYPGHGIKLARVDGQVFLFLNAKCKRLFNNKLKPSKLAWTALYRKHHKKVGRRPSPWGCAPALLRGRAVRRRVGACVRCARRALTFASACPGRVLRGCAQKEEVEVDCPDPLYRRRLPGGTPRAGRRLCGLGWETEPFHLAACR